MATIAEAKRRLTIEATTRGVKEATADMKAFAAGNDAIAVSETKKERSVVSGERALNRIQRQYDATWRSMQIYQKAERDLMLATNQGLITEERKAELLLMVAARHNQAAAAARGHATALNSLKAANQNIAGAGTFQTANIAAQFQDVGVTAAMGMNPLQIALQQGTQLSAVLNTMEKPVRGLAAAFMQVLNPVSLVTIAVVGLGAAAIQYFTRSAEQTDTLDDALRRHGQNIAEIKSRWGDAAKGIDEYARKSAVLIKAENILVGADLQRRLDEFTAGLVSSGDLVRTQARELQAELDRLQQAFVIEQDPARQQMLFEEIARQSERLRGASNDILVAGDRFGLFKQEIDAFAGTVRSGMPDFIALQDAIARRITADPTNAELRRLAEEIRPIIEEGDQLQRALTASESAIDSLGAAAARRAGDVKAFSDAMERLSNIAMPAQTDRQRAEELLRIGVAGAAGIDDIPALLRQYEDTIRRIENQEAGARVPIPTARPNVEMEGFGWEEGARSFAATQRERIDLLRTEIELIGQSDAVRARMISQLQAEQQIRRMGIDAQSGEAAAIRENAAAITEYTIQMQEAARQQAEVNQQAQFWGDLTMGVFDDLTSGADGFERALRRIVNTLADAALEAALFGRGPMAQLFGIEGGAIIGSHFSQEKQK